MKLHRPYIPLAVRIKVAERQFKALRGEEPAWKSVSFSDLDFLLFLIADWLHKVGETRYVPHSTVGHLHLDHDPALTNRQYNARTKKYTPDANDPDYLIYRTKEAHDIKTRVRGDGAQLSDLAIRRKNKRIAKKKRQARRPWPKRKFPKSQRKISLTSNTGISQSLSSKKKCRQWSKRCS